MADQLNICSLNCEGIKRSSDYISSFLNSNDCDILCLQEVWLLQCNIKELSTINDNYLYTGVSGVDDGEKIIQGHPPGGVAILYKKSLGSFITRVNSTNRRVCGISMTIGIYTFKILSIYMPCDNRSTIVNENILTVLIILSKLLISWIATILYVQVTTIHVFLGPMRKQTV